MTGGINKNGEVGLFVCGVGLVNGSWAGWWWAGRYKGVDWVGIVLGHIINKGPFGILLCTRTNFVKYQKFRD